MRSPDAVSVRCRAPPRTRWHFYRALAHALVEAPAPAGAVFETVAPEAVPWVTLRPARVVQLLLAAPTEAYGSLEVRPVAPPPRPPAGGPERQGIVIVLPSSAPSRTEPPALDPPAIDRWLGRTGWLGFQTFWIAGPRGTLSVARRFRFSSEDREGNAERFALLSDAIATDWSLTTGRTIRIRPSGARGRWSWHRRTLGGFPPNAWIERDPASIARTAETPWIVSRAPTAPPTGHTIVFGSSGAGKTTYLAGRAAEAIAQGRPVVVLDLHGDLAPAIVASLDAAGAARLIAVDAGNRPVPGIAALGGDVDEDRAAALFVATIKRLTADSGELYWGFRLERIFDTFVRLVQESAGSLLDLYDLLTSDARRESAQLATRRPDLARFLEELGPIVRRNPEFLWAAATRLSKVALVPSLAELLAPPDGGLPVESILAERRSLLVRLPTARLGPEAAAMAGTFVLARVFLGLAGASASGRGPTEVLLVLDEVQGFSPRLVAEVLAESRKFGLRAIVATQYPERLAPELHGAAAGASAEFVSFRVPPAAAADAGRWLGMDRDASERLLPSLPTGRGVALDAETGLLRAIPPVPFPGAPAERPWTSAVDRTRRDFAIPLDRPSRVAENASAERLLLAVLAAEEEGNPLHENAVVRSALDLPGLSLDPAALDDAWRSIVRRNWIERDGSAVRLAPAGARFLGLTTPTGATSESGEHRRLLLRTFRIFARRGYRLEILRQGRFDTMLPDARFRQIPALGAGSTPEAIARAIDAARLGWAWRYFGGRDVHVEAEVSGALRPERLRRGWTKAERQGAAVLFVVGDAPRAARVRRALARWGVGRERSFVWTIPAAEAPRITHPANG